MPLINVNSTLKGGSLEDKVNNNRAILVYHWNKCGHCIAFMPLLHEVMKTFNELNNKANVFEIEYSNFNYLPSNLRNVNAFPYIVAYKNGSIIEEFNDQRTIPNIKSFISRNSEISQQPSKQISSTSKQISSSSKERPLKKRRVLKKYNKTKSKSN